MFVAVLNTTWSSIKTSSKELGDFTTTSAADDVGLTRMNAARRRIVVNVFIARDDAGSWVSPQILDASIRIGLARQRSIPAIRFALEEEKKPLLVLCVKGDESWAVK